MLEAIVDSSHAREGLDLPFLLLSLLQASYCFGSVCPVVKLGPFVKFRFCYRRVLGRSNRSALLERASVSKVASALIDWWCIIGLCSLLFVAEFTQTLVLLFTGELREAISLPTAPPDRHGSQTMCRCLCRA